MRLVLLIIAWSTALAAAETNQFRPPPDLFAAPRLEMLPRTPQPPIYFARFPLLTPARVIRAMVWTGGRLWISAETMNQPAPGEVGRLWTLDVDANLVQQATGAISENWVSSVTAFERRLWLALDGGVAALEWDGRGVEAFGAQRGITLETVTGVTDLAGGVAALAVNGAEFYRRPGGSNFVQVAGPPELARPHEGGWPVFAASGLWTLAAGSEQAIVRRHPDGAWTQVSGAWLRVAPQLETSRITGAVGDGNGGFWVGSNVGLHFVDADGGRVENRFAAGSVKVMGGFDIPLSPWLKPTAAAQQLARQRMMAAVRDRMRRRVQLARLNPEDRLAASFVWPTSRLPGGVTAMTREQDNLWIAASDGLNTNQTRILLYHPHLKKWVGWFELPGVVRCMASNDRLLFLGMQPEGNAQKPALAAVEKIAILATPPARWAPDAVANDEVEQRLASLTSKDRAVFHFFSGQADAAIRDLTTGATATNDMDAESLFLLAFANDSAGLDRPAEMGLAVERLRQRYPADLLTELAVAVAGNILPHPQKTAVRAPNGADGETAMDVLARRDLDGDGRINPLEFRLWRGDGADFKAADRDGDGFLNRDEVDRLLHPK